MLSYHNDPAVKAAHIAQAERHAAQDMLLEGTYGMTTSDGFRGCSVGCFAHDIDPTTDDYHALVAVAAGWPEWLVRLSDTLFEGLPAGEREAFHVELRRRVPVGVDLEPVRHAIGVARMDRLIEQQGAAPDAPYKEQVLAALRQVRAYHEAPTESARSAAWSAARSAAESARSARSAEPAAESARSAAETGARSAARSARSAAWSARSAESAAETAAESAAESAAYIAERDALYNALEAAQ